MANLIIISGPQAVGKMTVAESLRDKLKYNMMMNHDSLEISDRIFGFATPAQKEFNELFREKAFETALKHGVDLIFTYVCAFDEQEDVQYLKDLEAMFTNSGGQFYFVELSADLETRLQRNETPHRLERKPSKKDVAWSREELITSGRKYRLNSYEDEYLFKHHLKIDNTHLTPEEAADRIIDAFDLKANEKEEREYRYGV